jgi:hypothetical protein
MTEQKRARGRPKKVAENPDCEVATKGFVKCVARKYHENQTILNMKHRQGSEGVIMSVMWGVISLGCLAWWFAVNDITAQVFCVVSGMLFVNALCVAVGWDDTIRESSKRVGFIQPHTEPPCEPKRECDER